MTTVQARPLRTRPTVSVVIPCYNYGHYLADAVSSALGQQGVDVDVLIVDDSSADGSAKVARSLAEKNGNVSTVLHQTNEGHIQTYNDGLVRARGDYVVLLSADDLLAPNALKRAVALMESHPRVGLVYGFAMPFEGALPEHVDERVRDWAVWDGTVWLRTVASRGRNVIRSPEVVMRREAYEQVGGYDARLPHTADFDMWLRTALTWDIGRVNGPAQALYRVHDTNMHRAYASKLLNLRERRETFDILFEEHAAGREDLEAVRLRAMRALAREALLSGVAAHVDGTDLGIVAEYRHFAAQTYPEITAGLPWRMWQHASGPSRRLPGVPVRRAAAKDRHALLWRRVRRYGL